ncbi:PiggyBac transposable element-derived protein 4-like 9 [Homarus americanus]|uniref:PiggyBac transposable element-derived protein 4-like 9 n=1 Tax=Homarus americanus TaxID=6706 RepID=A0A8J5J9U6_HOMAM|nr:PiggyBac transposable element-derived protein 4-like 9 [Homarus americanus]
MYVLDPRRQFTVFTVDWKEVTVRCLCAAWRPLWPECVLQRDFEGFGELEEEAVVHEIVCLGNSIGLEVDDVEELVEEHSKELSTEELLEFHKEENETLKRSLTSEESGEDEDKEESRIIPAKDLKDAFFSWSKLSKLAEDYHPNVGSVQKAIKQISDHGNRWFNWLILLVPTSKEKRMRYTGHAELYGRGEDEHGIDREACIDSDVEGDDSDSDPYYVLEQKERDDDDDEWQMEERGLLSSPSPGTSSTPSISPTTSSLTAWLHPPNTCQNKRYQNVVFDESLMLWRGNIGFCQYIPSKHHRFGLKLFVICNCKTGFMLDIVLDTRNATEVTDDMSLGMAAAVVKTLMAPFLNNNHCLYVGNWYTGPALFEEHNKAAAFEADPFTTSASIRHDLALQCSTQTVRNRHMEARMEYALEYADKEDSFWDRVVFCDEKTFCTDSPTSNRNV